jgi:hypothetical protein
VSNDDLFGAPAGWYPDPLGLPQLRWWNNHAWTEQTSAARQPMIVQDTKFAWADDDRPTRREERERERSRSDFNANDPIIPTSDSLRELEPPRAYTQVSQGMPTAPSVAQPTPTAPQPPMSVQPSAAPAPSAPASPATASPAPAPSFSAPSFSEPSFSEPSLSEPAATQQTVTNQPTSVQPPVAAPPTVTPAATTSTAAPAPTTEEASPFPSFYQPDPIVTPAEPATQPAASVPFTATPSLDEVFRMPRRAAADESLDALFGAKESRRTQTRVKIPIVTVEQVPATKTGSASFSSAPAWIIALVPLLQLFSAVMLITALGQNGSKFLYIGILAVPYLLVVALANVDYRNLTNAGVNKPVHWAWAFATAPVYLLLRARVVIRETGHGIGPVLVWFAFAFLHAASIIAVPGVIISLIPEVFAAQIEQSVESDAFLITGSMPEVTCPATPPVLPGEQIKCQSVSVEGKTSIVTVAMARSNGWIDWQTINWGGPDMGTAELPTTPAADDSATDGAPSDGTTTAP